MTTDSRIFDVPRPAFFLSRHFISPLYLKFQTIFSKPKLRLLMSFAFGFARFLKRNIGKVCGTNEPVLCRLNFHFFAVKLLIV